MLLAGVGFILLAIVSAVIIICGEGETNYYDADGYWHDDQGEIDYEVMRKKE